MLYSSIPGITINSPGSSLETLNGSANPSTGGIYTYTDSSNLILSPQTTYFIVLTSGTAVANGAYDWSYGSEGPNSLYNPSGGWVAPPFDITDDNYQSSNGSNWSHVNFGEFAQFAITATPIPEPSSSLLLLLGSGVFIYVRRAFHR
jgi:hypothetical protein